MTNNQRSQVMSKLKKRKKHCYLTCNNVECEQAACVDRRDASHEICKLNERVHRVQWSNEKLCKALDALLDAHHSNYRPNAMLKLWNNAMIALDSVGADGRVK